MPAHGLPVVEVDMGTVSKGSKGTQEVVRQDKVLQAVLHESAVTVKIVGSSRASMRCWIQKPWRSSKWGVRRIKVIGRCGCTSRESTWAPRWGSTRWWKVKIVIVIREKNISYIELYSAIETI